jgi:hypothetical protein
MGHSQECSNAKAAKLFAKERGESFLCVPLRPFAFKKVASLSRVLGLEFRLQAACARKNRLKAELQTTAREKLPFAFANAPAPTAFKKAASLSS